MSSKIDTLAILHIALDPVTGPWSVMRELALAQMQSGRYVGVGLGVIASSHWPTRYRDEAKSLPLSFYESPTMAAFGTAKFVWQRLKRPPLESWIRRFAEETGAERVICHFHNAWMSGVFLPLPQIRGVEVDAVATFHGVNADLEGKRLRHALHRWMARRFLRFGATLTSVDADNLERAKDLFGLDPMLFTVIPNGVPVPERTGLAWTGEDELVVGHLGSISEQKGWRIAAEAVQQVAATGRRIRMLIAGAGPQEEEAREAAAASDGIVEFVGHVAKPARDFLPRLHAMVAMSRHEGLPMSILEGLAAGLPVFSTAVGGIPDVLGDGKAGLLLERNPEALVQALLSLYDHPPRQLKLAKGAHAVFRERFEISQIVEKYHSLYHPFHHEKS